MRRTSVMASTISGSSPSIGATRRALSSIVFLPIFGKVCSTLKSLTCEFFGSTSSSSERNAGMSHWPIAEIVKELAFHRFRRDAELRAKRRRRPFHPQLAIQHQQRLGHGLDDGVGVVRRVLQPVVGALRVVDVEEDQHRAGDLVVGRFVRAHLQAMPAPLPVAQLALLARTAHR